ncbi:MAG: MarR family transcriptional regulator [Oscillospiraceae bacterium]|nr:MarR family transcriptional regulator [Oscillospiraceae bacterium]
MERFETFTVLMAKINRNIRRIKLHEMSQHNLGSVHTSCLYYLSREDSLTAAELCELCQEDKATISRALSRLEADGYVLSRESEGKRYKAPIVLSEKGEAVGGEIAAKIGAVLDSIGKELSPEERVEFYRCLNIISACLEKAANA